jgi:hypothetical protein
MTSETQSELLNMQNIDHNNNNSFLFSKHYEFVIVFWSDLSLVSLERVHLSQDCTADVTCKERR